MNVELRGITYPVGVPCQNAEEFVAYCARVSNPGNQHNQDTADKLIRYLIKNAHWSPFEMVSMTIEIDTTRDIGRQILRHRSFSFQEFSQRYAVASTQFSYREARLQDAKNRQNSIKTDNHNLQRRWQFAQRCVAYVASKVYMWGLSRGVAKEQARAVLPEGLTNTRMYMSGTLRSWIHYCQLRCGNGTQLEHKEIADEVMKIIEAEFPSIYKALQPELVVGNKDAEIYGSLVTERTMTPNYGKSLLETQPRN